MEIFVVVRWCVVTGGGRPGLIWYWWVESVREKCSSWCDMSTLVSSWHSSLTRSLQSSPYHDQGEQINIISIIFQWIWDWDQAVRKILQKWYNSWSQYWRLLKNFNIFNIFMNSRKLIRLSYFDLTQLSLIHILSSFDKNIYWKIFLRDEDIFCYKYQVFEQLYQSFILGRATHINIRDRLRQPSGNMPSKQLQQKLHQKCVYNRVLGAESSRVSHQHILYSTPVMLLH